MMWRTDITWRLTFCVDQNVYSYTSNLKSVILVKFEAEQSIKKELPGANSNYYLLNYLFSYVYNEFLKVNV